MSYTASYDVASNVWQAVSGGTDGRTKMVWVETPANPSWTVTDIAAAAAAAHAAGAALVVDATVLTPLICRPIHHGADFVVGQRTRTLSKPELKASMVSALETIIS